MAIIDLGKVGITPQGEWAASKPYEELSLVTRNGRAYLSLRDTTGDDPELESSREDWMLITERGESLYQMMVRTGRFDGTEDEFLQAYEDSLEACRLVTEAAREALKAVDVTMQKVSDDVTNKLVEMNNKMSEVDEHVKGYDTNEEEREAAELKREKQETQRTNAEAGREVAETERVQKEARRDEQMTQLVNDAQTAINMAGEAQQATETALQNINKKEGEMEAAELQREKAEQERSQQEQAREVKETERQQAFEQNEQQRSQTFQHGEQSRQQTADDAETQREQGFQTAQQERDADFQSKEAEREAAMQTISQEAQKLTELVENDASQERTINGLKDQVNNYKPIEIFGNVTNAADEEDITSENGLLKFKNRSSLNGMGYVILRKDKTFAEQVTESNTIYEIRYDFDLGGASLTVPAGCVLHFIGGKLQNGTLVLDGTNSIISAPKQIFSSVILNGEIANTENIRASWFGGLAACLTSIQRLYNQSNLPIDVYVDTNEAISSTIVVKRGKMNLIFLKEVTTTISNGTPILEIDSTTSDIISFLTIVDFKVNFAYPETQTIQNCVGIKLTGGNSGVAIVRPRIYYVQTGILFTARSSYLSCVIDATIIRCGTGIQIKKVGSNWQNGLYFSFKDLSKNSIGFHAEQGGRNTLEFKCSEVGSNDVGIKISGGYYELIGTQWNENAITSALVVENDGVVRLTGNSGINNIDKLNIGNDAAFYEDKGQEMYPVRDLVDQRNLSFGIDFNPGFVNERVSGTKLPIVRGDTAKIGDVGVSYFYNLPSGNYIHNGYIDVKPIVLKNGVSIIMKGCSETNKKQGSGVGYNIELTNDTTISVSDTNRYRILIHLLKGYHQIDIYKGSIRIANAASTVAPTCRLTQYTYAFRFDHLSTADIYKNAVVNLGVDESLVDALKEVEFKYLRIEGTSVSNLDDVLYINSILVFSKKMPISSLRHLAENNAEIISDVLTSGATTDRPSASKVGAGFQYFDTTIGKPVYSTGSTWVDATGAPV